MNNNGKMMYMVSELMTIIKQISEEYNISYAEAQRLIVEAYDHIMPVNVPIIRERIDTKKVTFKLNKARIQHVI